jgi:hypothetical protein
VVELVFVQLIGDAIPGGVDLFTVFIRGVKVAFGLSSSF